VREGDVLARMGGDEFTILLEEVDGECGAKAVAQRILDELELPFATLGREVYASASIGIAITQTGRDTPEDVLRNADIAMYRAKDQGKQRYELFSPELLTQAVSLLQLENDLKGALERGEFVLYYQPIVSLVDGALAGFEALIRWRHPQRGLVSPDEFIPLAEESGAILPIGAWVIEEACRQAAGWRNRFGAGEYLTVSVNLSARQFSSGVDMLEQISRSLAAQALDARCLCVEITESAIMRSPDLATMTLLELRRLGVGVHLDDFGTGYSSLGYLQRFPVDTLKIDRSFVSSSSSPKLRNPEIVRTITTLACSLALETTAEGIETEEQLEYLRSLGCTYGQGYYFSRPLSADHASALIANWDDLRLAKAPGLAVVAEAS
jgi:EAL domain-containing protein (putative c-di-GMP-specific phosphodiesterase class I)